MDCHEELSLIKEGLLSIAGVNQVRADFLSRSLLVQYDSAALDADQILQRLSRIGFAATRSASHPDELTVLPSGELYRREWSLAVGAMLLLAAWITWWNSAPELYVALLSTSAALTAGARVVRGAVRSLRGRSMDMYVLLTLAMFGALGLGEWLEAATVMVLFRASLLIDQWSRQRSHRAIHALLSNRPTRARRTARRAQAEEVLEEVEVEQLQVGDTVRILPGERIPADGRVLAGNSGVDESTLTGESELVSKEPGDLVLGGTLNAEGSLQVELTQTAANSAQAEIARQVEQASLLPSRSERLVEQFARWYTPLVVVIAMLMTLVPTLIAMLSPDVPSWTGAASVSEVARIWFFRSLVVLVVACPCALVLSTPVTLLCGLAQASRMGVLVKGGEYLERLAHVECVAVDKTGTLTVGRPQIVEVMPTSGYNSQDVLSLAAAVESHSEHPVARAIVREAARQKLALPAVSGFQVLRGYGVQGEIDGREIVAASPSYVESITPIGQIVDSRDASTQVLVLRDRSLVGVIRLRDQPRRHAATALEDWRSLGVRRIVMLTGDRPSAAESLAQELAIEEVYASLLPHQKVARVQELSRNSPQLVMLGDGVNDAPALAAAPIGVSMGAAAADIALETADIAILAPRLDRVGHLIVLSRQVRRVLIQNVSLAIAIKLLVLVLAAFGLATMWMAVVADVGASLLVMMNGLRILHFPNPAAGTDVADGCSLS